jgi:D-glycero-alpha-D-manno-heptose-7-phosphate kinase
MGSSSAYTAGLIKGLAMLKGVEMTRHELADLTCQVEIVNCGEPIGKQDQYASVFGGFNRITFGAKSVDVSPINIKSTTYNKLQQNLLMFDTGQARKTSDILKKIEPTEAWLSNMSVIRDYVFQAEAMLREDNVDDFGRLLDKAWRAKTKMAPGVTNLLYNVIYDRALGAGALGGKLLGAGGGGSFLFYVPADKVNHREFIAHMETGSIKHREFSFTDEGTKVIYNGSV